MMIKTSDHLNDSLSVSFIASAVPQAGAVDNAHNSFSKEFENVDIQAPKDTVDISSSGKNDNRMGFGGDNDRHDKFSKDADDRIIEQNGKEANAKHGPQDQNQNVENGQKNGTPDTENNTKGKNTGETEQTGQENNTGKSKTSGIDKPQEMKEILDNKLQQSRKIGDIKTGIKENFTEGKSMESTMLNNLEAKAKGIGDNTKNATTEKTADSEKTGDADIKAGEESAMEKKLMQEIDSGKSEKNRAQTELKVSKKESGTDNTGANLMNDASRSPQRLDFQAEIKKTADPGRLLEQYQELREKVAGTVENSIKMLMTTNESKVNLQLQPPELGKVEVELVVKDKQVSAKINTENLAVKEVILNSLDQLKSNLEEQGIHIARMDVEVGGFKNQFDRQFSESGSGNGNGNGRGGNGESARETFDYMADKVKNLQPVTLFLGTSINCLC